MTKTIRQSVGYGAANEFADVAAIQRLLNGVLPAYGGPIEKLKVDGTWGPKPQSAVSDFIRKQFGQAGVAKVDPGSPALKRLVDLSFGTLSLGINDAPVTAVGLGLSILPESTHFTIHRMGNKTSFNQNDSELFFYFVDVTNGYQAIYWLQVSAGEPIASLAPPMALRGASTGFRTRGAETLDRLECTALYRSVETAGSLTSMIMMNFRSGAVSIPMPHHLIGPDGMLLPAKDPRSANGSTYISGTMRFLRAA